MYEGISLLCSLWDLEKFRGLLLYIGSGTWKYSDICLYIASGLLCSLWDLEKSSLYRLWDLEEKRGARKSFRRKKSIVLQSSSTWRNCMRQSMARWSHLQNQTHAPKNLCKLMESYLSKRTFRVVHEEAITGIQILLEP